MAEMNDYISEGFPGFIESKFWTDKVKDDIKDEISQFNRDGDKVDFLTNIIEYCEGLKHHITSEKEYVIWDLRKDGEDVRYSSRLKAEKKLEWLINNGKHVHYKIKIKYK
jgi:hypothetical protein